jgi:hypothetical protein
MERIKFSNSAESRLRKMCDSLQCFRSDEHAHNIGLGGAWYDLSLLVVLTSEGIQLFFNPKSQFLQLIKVYELTKCQVSYKKTPITYVFRFSSCPHL